MENLSQEPLRKSVERPIFLLVLCILTFIGSGWSIFSNVYSLFTTNFMNSTIEMEQYTNMMEGTENEEIYAFLLDLMNSTMDVVKITAAHFQEITGMQLVLSLISLIGAILMFQLRRFGFYLYVVAQVLAVFIIPYFAGFSLPVVLMVSWFAFSALLFIILYAVNLKYMH